MGRWSEAFHAYVQARDTADTADTSQQGSVDTVTSVMLPDDHDHEVLPQNSERVSPVSTVSRPAERKKSTAYGQTAFLGRAITEGYRQAALRRPPSSADPAERPVHGCFCSCCKGRRWWCEREAPNGWRCWACHPPDHLPAEAVMEIRT